MLFCIQEVQKRVFYGVPKLMGNFFDYQLFALDSKLSDVSEFELAWYFFGKNRWQELFTGIMELVPGILLFNRRTYYTAAIILLPVTGQVFLLNLFFKIGGITFPAAIILLACNMYIIYSQKESILRFFRSLHFPQFGHSGKGRPAVIKVLRGMGIGLAVLVVLLQVKNVFIKSDRALKYQQLVGVYILQDMKKNNTDYVPDKDSLYYKNLYIEKQDRWNILRRCNDQMSAFRLDLSTKNDSLALFINRGGMGDDPDIIDTQSVLRGVYKLDKDYLTINGVYLDNKVQLKYKKQSLKPKGWFW